MTKGEITQLSRSIEGLKSIKVNCNLTHYQFDSLVYALAVLERVEVETIEKVLKESSIVKSCEGIGGIELEVEKLSQSIVKELTGKVGK